MVFGFHSKTHLFKMKEGIMKTTRSLNKLFEECQKIIDAGNFDSMSLPELDSFTATIVCNFLDSAKLKWQSSPSVGPGRVIKIDDKYLTYLLTMPYKSYDEQTCDQFYWMIGDDLSNDDHVISPDVASAHLTSIMCPGIKIVDIRSDDGSSTTRATFPDGRMAEVRFPPGFLLDETWRRDLEEENGK